METEMIEKPEFKKIEQEGTALQIKADAIVIVDDATRKEAAEFLKMLTLRETQVELLTEEPWRAALAGYEKIQQWRKGLIARFTNPKKTVKERIGQYDWNIAEKKRKEDALAEVKARAAAQKARDAEIAAAKKSKDAEAVEALKQAPLVVAPIASKTQAPAKVEGVSTRFEWKLESIFNAMAIPLEYHTIVQKPDGTYICRCVDNVKARIKSLQGAHGIPGVKAVQVPIVSGRV